MRSLRLSRQVIARGMLLLGIALAPLTSDARGRTRPELVSGSISSDHGVLTAGLDGAIWALPRGAHFSASAGSELRVFTKPQGLMLDPPRRTPTYTIVLMQGVVHADAGDGKSAILVSAGGKLNAIVKRGSMAFAARARHAAVASLGGDVLTATGGAYSALKPSHAVDLGPGQAATTRELLAAPQPQLEERVAFAARGHAHLQQLRWPALANAARYEVELRGGNLTRPLRRSGTEPQLGAPLGPLSPGRYEVTVRGVEASGLPGHGSAPLPFTVVGATLPEGAWADDDGTLHLGEGQVVEFSPVTGLDLEMGRDGRFSRTDGKVTWRGSDELSVFFRQRGSLSVARAKLAPRGLRAEIRFAPRNPKWPRDPVKVWVRMQAESPRALSGVEPEIQAELGIQPLEVEPELTSDGYLLSVPPQPGRGPWVLRIAVRDQWGSELGRNFVEISREPRPPQRQPASE